MPVFTGVVLALTISPTLVLGVYRNGKLRYFGRPGTGFWEKGMRETIDRPAPLLTDKPIRHLIPHPPSIGLSPLHDEKIGNAPVQFGLCWVAALRLWLRKVLQFQALLKKQGQIGA